MSNMTRFVQTRYNLNSACESLSVAYWTQETFHIDSARQRLTQALCGGKYEDLLDLIEEAISDTHDLDVTDRDYAVAVAEAILNYAVPRDTDKEIKMVNQATGVTQADIGKFVIVSGYAGKGKVLRVIGRTVEVELRYGKLMTDQDKVFLLDPE